MPSNPIRETTPDGCIPHGQEDGYRMGLRDGADAIKGAVAGWLADRRKALSKQGIVSGHDHADLVALEQVMESVEAIYGKR